MKNYRPTNSLSLHTFVSIQCIEKKKKNACSLPYKYMWLNIVIRDNSLRNFSVFVRLAPKFILQNQTELIRRTADTLNIMTVHLALNNRHENRILFAPC